jgi:hypothetical protein
MVEYLPSMHDPQYHKKNQKQEQKTSPSPCFPQALETSNLFSIPLNLPSLMESYNLLFLSVLFHLT